MSVNHILARMEQLARNQPSDSRAFVCQDIAERCVSQTLLKSVHPLHVRITVLARILSVDTVAFVRAVILELTVRLASAHVNPVRVSTAGAAL